MRALYDSVSLAVSRSCNWWLLVILATILGAFSVAAQQLFLIEFKRDGFGLVDGLAGSSGVAVSNDGRFVYAVSRSDDTLTVFEREPIFGSLNFVEDHAEAPYGVFGMAGASAVAASSDGRHVYVSASVDDTLLVFARDATSDALSFIGSEAKRNLVGGVFGLDGASSVTVSHDDRLVFVTGDVDDAVAVFSRDATRDTLAYVETELDGFDGVEGLDGAAAVAVSPDDRHIYVTGRVDDSLALFVRQVDGTIRFSTTYTDGTDGIDGLDGAQGVAVSPDGLHVYVAASVDDAVASFSRDSVTGELSFLGVERDGVDNVDGLAGASAVVVSPLGDRLYVAGRDDNAVALFRRQPSTGALELLEVERPVGPGLRGAVSLAVAPDALHLYAASFDDDAVTGLYVALCEGDELLGDSDLDAFCDDIDACIGDDFAGDDDGDGICNDLDRCVGFDDTADADGDGVADACDLCEGDDSTGDTDGDRVCDGSDLCAGFDDTADGDGDTVADGCDVCFGNDASGDADNDLVCDDNDACPGFDDGTDDDGDRVPDGCDQCFGDDLLGDSDGDQVCDDIDCAPDDASSAWIDSCGVCGGQGTTCALFADGFESGLVEAWSSSTQ